MGDYRPLSYLESDGDYWGFGIEMTRKMAERLGMNIEFVQTACPCRLTPVSSNAP